MPAVIVSFIHNTVTWQVEPSLPPPFFSPSSVLFVTQNEMSCSSKYSKQEGRESYILKDKKRSPLHLLDCVQRLLTLELIQRNDCLCLFSIWKDESQKEPCFKPPTCPHEALVHKQHSSLHLVKKHTELSPGGEWGLQSFTKISCWMILKVALHLLAEKQQVLFWCMPPNTASNK